MKLFIFLFFTATKIQSEMSDTDWHNSYYGVKDSLTYDTVWMDYFVRLFVSCICESYFFFELVILSPIQSFS